MKLSPQSAPVPRCYGYVQYESERSAEAAVARINGKEFWKKKVGLVVDVPYKMEILRILLNILRGNLNSKNYRL